MKVLIYASGQDTGGQGWRLAEAFARHAPEWTLEAWNASPSTLGYPEQNVAPMARRRFLIRDAYRAADVVHLRNNLSGRVFDVGMCKPTVIQYHGSDFRANHGQRAYQAREAGVVQVAATVDLAILEPDVTWLPAPYAVDDLAAMRAPIDDDVIRIAYFPTSPGIKSTAAFMAAYRSLAKRHRLELLTNVGRGDRIRAGSAFGFGWPDVLAMKARADILFDQVILGYGNNAIEAWCMGVPVVAGVADPFVRQAMLERWGALPFVEATEQTIEQTLERLIESAEMRREWGESGQQHARRFHDYPVVVDLLRGIYASAPPSRDTSIPQRFREKYIRVPAA